MGFDNAYEAITEPVDDHRWAYGTGFNDPLSSLDWTVPAGIDGPDLAEYCLMLGDDALVMSHRLQQWLTRSPELEEETALANIGLDLLGQARLLLTRAGTADGSGRDEDSLAFLRDAGEFRNLQFVELPCDDFAELVVRLLVFTTFRLAVFTRLRDSADPVLAAIAAKSVNEMAYHREYAAGWVVRLGDGTEHSRARAEQASSLVLAAAGELFDGSDVERRLSGVAVDPADVRTEFDAVLAQVMQLATLAMPVVGTNASAAGRTGQHTAHLAEILDEMQGVARATAGATW